MNPLIQLKKATALAVFVLVCFALPQLVQATDLDGVLPGGNTADGFGVLTSLTTGGYNTGTGWFSLKTVSSGSSNTAFGAATLLANTGSANTAIGAAALFSNTTGLYNTANGYQALYSCTDAWQNTATGAFALYHNISGTPNVANGYQALYFNTNGFSNTANGPGALYNNTIGTGNTADGINALYFNTVGNDNIGLGVLAGENVTTASHVIAIGSLGKNVSNSCFIGNIRGVTTVNADAIPVLIDSAGQLGTASSSRRFKREIKAMDRESEAILGLKPVTFKYKSDKTATPQFGLIAEEAAAVNSDLVVRDSHGEIYTVRYDAVNAMLLNEFLKEHKRVQELNSTVAKQEAAIVQQRKNFAAAIAQQQSEIASLTATVKEQAAQIQKVFTQIKLAKPAPQMVDNE